MSVAVFEDDGWGDFAPLAALRHLSLLRWGTMTLHESVRRVLGGTEVLLWGREELGEVTEAATRRKYNKRTEGESLLLNARARPVQGLKSIVGRGGRFVATAGNFVVAARLDTSGLEPGVMSKRQLIKLSKSTDVLELPHKSVFRGSWDMVESNGLAIAEQARRFQDQLELPAGTGVKGLASNLAVHGTAEVEDHVTFDARPGPVIVDEGASVDSFSRITGPCYVGPRARVHSALLRGGTSVFEGSRIGGEVENSIIMPHTNKAHHGYVGDSLVGEWVNLGAGSNFSNLKNTYGSVRIELAGRRLDTGMVKLGSIVGDMAKVSIGAGIFTGMSVGTASQVTGLVDGNVPSFTYYDGRSGKMVELLLDSVLETQKRMMERRGMTLSKAEEALTRAAFKSTSAERRKAGVRRGRIA